MASPRVPSGCGYVLVAIGGHRLAKSTLRLWVRARLCLSRQLRDTLDGCHLRSDSRVWLKVLLCFDLQVVDQLVEEVRLLFHAVEVIIKFCSFNSTDPFTHKLVCLVYLLCQALWQEGHPGGLFLLS